MAKKKLTPQQRQIESLAKNYQASITALGPEYEKLFAQRQEKLGEYNKNIEAYSQTLEAYNQRIADYQSGKVVNWVEAPIVRQTKTRSGNPMSYVDVPSWFEDFSRGKTWGSGETYAGRSNAEMMIASGLPVKKESGKIYLGQLAQLPEKMTAVEPAAPDMSAYDTQLQGIEAQKRTAQETFEREKGERRSARLRAVTQGSKERPMLSRGVTLNG